MRDFEDLCFLLFDKHPDEVEAMPLGDVLKTIRRHQLIETRETERLQMIMGGPAKPARSSMSEAEKIALVKRLHGNR